MFEGFVRRSLPGGSGVTINVVVGGEGPPLLLLHGYPQNHAMWHRVAPLLASRFTIVAPDLRGYGDSDKPPGGDDHAGYSKRAMAADNVAVMRGLGHERFFVAGHDRGARVAHRLALDYPAAVRALAVLDVAPTREMFRGTTMAFATAYYHWFFLIQPYDLPERLIGADPAYYLAQKMTAGTGFFAPEAYAEYLRCFRDPACIHATCEDYRAAATIDLEHDDADGERKVEAPLLVLWGRRGTVARCFDPLALWRERARDVRGEALDGGHYMAEELPRDVARKLAAFFPAGGLSAPPAL